MIVLPRAHIDELRPNLTPTMNKTVQTREQQQKAYFAFLDIMTDLCNGRPSQTAMAEALTAIERHFPLSMQVLMKSLYYPSASGRQRIKPSTESSSDYDFEPPSVCATSAFRLGNSLAELDGASPRRNGCRR